MKKYYVWQDVALAINMRRRDPDWPVDWKRVNVYDQEIEIEITSDYNVDLENNAIKLLKKWFGSRINEKNRTFILDSPPQKPRSLSISFNFIEADMAVKKYNRPLFRAIDYNEVKYPSEFSSSPLLIAFHSYKGGVGRTLSALSFCRSICKHRSESKTRRLLIIDADIEAPGLTWLAREQGEKGKFNDFSLLDALALIHEDEQWEKDTLDFIADKIREELLYFPVDGIETEHFFLPAYRDDSQLISMPIVPQDVIQFRGREWLIGDFLYKLGKKLDVDAVIIDLRAGISEYAAPILFDPRIQHIFVTTTSLQSVYGVELLLKQVIERMPKTKEAYKKPYIFVSMVTDEGEKMFNDISERLIPLFMEDNEIEYELPIKKLPFTESLIHLEDLRDIDRKLQGTQFEKEIDEVVKEIMSPDFDLEEQVDFKEKEGFLEQVEALCRNMEYAETNETTHFLKTLPIRNLAQKFISNVPVAIVMGAKGSGKTFIYLQVVKKRDWKEFVKEVVHDVDHITDGIVLPLLSSRNLLNQKIVQDCLEENLKKLNWDTKYNINDLYRQIENKLLQEDRSEFSWQQFWINELAKIIGLTEEKDYSIQDINEFLKNKNKRLVFIVDGLEDIFSKINESEVQQIAVKALCQGIIPQIREIPQSNLGFLVFVRKDIVKQSIHQNFGQFSRIYEPFELKWNQLEALRLVLWICKTVDEEWKITSATQEIEYLNREIVEQSLLPLWGLKLGKDDSKEAYTANWVVSALSDFRGQLQARDIVRFLRQASWLMRNQPYNTKYNRYLQPSAVRQAIDYCSTEKVVEIAEEIPILDTIFNKIRNIPESQREIPFERESLGLTIEEIRLLESLGIVFKQDEGYYMPEIFRRGLNFKYKKGARPKVINLLKNALRSS